MFLHELPQLCYLYNNILIIVGHYRGNYICAVCSRYGNTELIVSRARCHTSASRKTTGVAAEAAAGGAAAAGGTGTAAATGTGICYILHLHHYYVRSRIPWHLLPSVLKSQHDIIC